MKYVLCDLDGTLFNIDHRLHLLEDKKWDEFYAACKDDTVNEWCQVLLSGLIMVGIPVIFVSGRNEIVRLETMRQLQELGFKDCKLYMRPRDNRQSDVDFKRKLLNTELAALDILFAIEDRKRVADMWRENGIVCLQCEEGEF